MNNNSNSVVGGALAVFAVVGAIVGFAGLFLYGAWASAFVAVHLWKWYVMKAFGVEALKMIHAYGIALLISYWTYHHRSQHTKDQRETQDKVIEFIMILLYPWIVLFFGWIGYALFM